MTDNTFKQPINIDNEVWRYLSLSKYLNLVSTSKLWLSSLSSFEDPLEGTIPKKNLELINSRYNEIPEDKRIRLFSDLGKILSILKKNTFACCWHMNDVESAAMWKLYGGFERSIAIKSTYRKIMEVLPENFSIGMITYIDFNKDIFPEENLNNYFMHKHKSFFYENEVRIILNGSLKSKIQVDDNDKTQSPLRFYLDNQIHNLNTLENLVDNDHASYTIPINIEKTIDAIYIDPLSPDWFFQVLSDVNKKYAINTPIFKSEMII